jgi:ATP-binding protein involved in chromosome partitioning
MAESSTCSNDQICGACSSAQSCDSQTQERHLDELLDGRLAQIRNRIAVMSGKGGVGKTTVAVNLAVALASAGKAVGILDADVHGPNIPKMLGLNGRHPTGGEAGLVPITSSENVKVMSMAFMLPDEDTPVVWRGPMKHGVFKQFLAEVDWGKLDYLIVDLPPGTGDEPLSIASLLGKPLWAIVVTTPQDVALLDSRKSVVFGHTLEMNVLGIVENMSGLTCPHCGAQIDLFKTGGGERSSKDLLVPFLGAIPIEPAVVSGGDAGIPISVMSPDSRAAEAFRSLADQVEAAIDGKGVGQCDSCAVTNP